MTTVISELRSVTFQCRSTAVHVSKIESRTNNDMAPQQHDALPKSSDMEVEESQKSSPISNLGTSVDSSPPHLSNEEATENINDYETGQAQTSNPFSDDSGSIQSCHMEQDGFQSPLEQLQSAFGKNGMHPKNLTSSDYASKNKNNSLPSNSNGVHDGNLPSTSTGIYDSSMPSTSTGIYNNGMPYVDLRSFSNIQSMPPGLFETKNPFACHLCEYVGGSKEEYDAHMTIHYNHRCTYCGYTSRTEGRLQRHITDFHSETPPDSWAGSRTRKNEMNSSEQSRENNVTPPNGKRRLLRCKHCEFVSLQKNEMWQHSKVHIKAEKLLQCPHCAFVTDLKHHYEYHLSNHFGRKPFKCSMCNYKCVNKSMLNSHMKSHSNIYQFRCADCPYVTKYCHSMKQHLKNKKGHTAGPVLNQDGTPSSVQMIDVYGRRRGPRTKKRKIPEVRKNSRLSPSDPTNQQPVFYSAAVPIMQPTIYPSINYPRNFPVGTTHQLNSNYPLPIPLPSVPFQRYECAMCHYITYEMELFQRHIIIHAKENPDFAKLYGIDPELLQNNENNNDNQQMALSNINSQRNCIEYVESSIEKISRSYAIGYDEKREFNDTVLEPKSIKTEDRSSPDYHKYINNSSPRNEESDTFKEYSSPSPAHSTVCSTDLSICKRQDGGERSVIVSEETSQNLKLNENPSNGNDSPIDLSASKSSALSKSNKKISEAACERYSLGQKRSTSPTNMESSNMSSTNRHRRKGKAFKIDHYMQCDEYQLNQELMSKENNRNDLADLYADTIEGIDKIWKEKTQNIEKTAVITADKQQNVEFQMPDTSNRVYTSSPDEPRSPPNKSSVPRAQSPNRNSSPNSECNLTGINDIDSHNESMSPMKDSKDNSNKQNSFECRHCKTIFSDWVIFTVHMGFHSPENPFMCNMCKCVTKSAVDFFIHLVRVSHL